MSAWIVQKYGGTSVGKLPECIAGEIVRSYLQADYRVAVVCSARSTGLKSQGTTTRLLAAADKALCGEDFNSYIGDIREDYICASDQHVKSETLRNELVATINAECDSLVKILEAARIIDEISPRTLDSIMGVGERLSCMFIASLMNDLGVAARYVDLSHIFPVEPHSQHEPDIHSSSTLGKEFWQEIPRKIVAEINDVCKDGSVPVITGFFGVVPGGLLKTVGRGYTDLCAALVAVGFAAEELQIWKEVDGIFSADPRKVAGARLVPSITPEEASELTYYGSEVIHPFTMTQVINAQIPIRIKNVFNPKGNGTIIFPDHLPLALSRGGSETPLHPPKAIPLTKQLELESLAKRPTAVTTKSHILVLNVHSNRRDLSHGFLAHVFSILDQYRLVVDLISTSEVRVSMALHAPDRSESSLRQALAELRKFGSVDVTRNLCIVSLVGKQMKRLIGIAGQMFTVLAEAEINIEMISQGASEINISCVISESDALKALNVIHEKLLLD